MIEENNDALLREVIYLHKVFNSIHPKFDCFDGNVFKMLDGIPQISGLIILFEKGENFENMNRIVFVGETKNFRKRINAYYLSHAKLVTHIYESLSNKLKSPVLQQDANEYVQKNISFVLVPMPESTKKERILLNKKILSTLSYCQKFKASENWLGNFSLQKYELITLSRLWAVKYVFEKERLEKRDFEYLEKYLER